MMMMLMLMMLMMMMLMMMMMMEKKNNLQYEFEYEYPVCWIYTPLTVLTGRYKNGAFNIPFCRGDFQVPAVCMKHISTREVTSTLSRAWKNFRSKDRTNCVSYLECAWSTWNRLEENSILMGQTSEAEADWWFVAPFLAYRGTERIGVYWEWIGGYRIPKVVWGI